MKIGLIVLNLSLAVALHGQDFRNSNWVADGKAINNASQFTIDIKGDFYRILTYQAMYDKPLTFFGVNYRSAPGSFLLDDGTVVEDNLNRILFAMGMRLGENAFMGLVADEIANGQLGDDYSRAFNTNITQGLFYGGFKYEFMQAAVAWQISPGQSGLNIRQELVHDSDSREIEQPDQNKMIYSIYVKPGIYVSYSEFSHRSLNPISDQVFEGPKQNELQIIAQSPERYLPDWAGLPFLALDRFTNVTFLNEEETEEETTFGTLGSDDIRLLGLLDGLGIRMAVQYKLKPTMVFRHLEASGKWVINDHLEFGLRSFVKNQSGTLALSTDEYISLGWKNKAKWSFVHSYNSPDRSTFIPIRGIHVYGFQVVYGISDIIKPLIPMIRSLSDSELYRD